LGYIAEIVGLISIVILLFVSVKYNDLTKEYKKSARLYTTLGVLSYFLPFVIVNNLFHITYNTSQSFSMTAGFISGSIISSALYFSLKKTWANNNKNNPDILDDDMMI